MGDSYRLIELQMDPDVPPFHLAKIRIALVDDCALYRQGIAQALANEEGVEVVGEAASAGEAMRVAYETKPDIVILSGKAEPDLSTIPALRGLHPQSKIIVIGWESDECHAKAALLVGARAYVPKEVTPAQLVETVHRVLQDDLVVAAKRVQTEQPQSALTPREQQVLDRIARGLSNKEIAQKLRISEKTVKQHITRILAKIGGRNRVEAALRAIDLAKTKGQ
jgi:DNA-binding NarL/FixJ family response regulator